MNFIRQALSASRVRTRRDGFDLDMSYITSRIIAMSFPGEGLGSLFRNPIGEVSFFLQTFHRGRYIVVNLSEKKYDFTKFDNNVRMVDWLDHNAYPVLPLAELIFDLLEHMLDDPEQVIVVHCLAGKGRTGTLINCLMFASGEFRSIREANELYLRKRGVGVSNLCQLRCMEYFAKFFSEGSESLDVRPRRITRIFLRADDKNFMIFTKFRADVLSLQSRKVLASVEFAEGSGEYEGTFFAPVEAYEEAQATDLVITLSADTGVSFQKLCSVSFCIFFVKDKAEFSKEDFDSVGHLPNKFEMEVLLEPATDIDPSIHNTAIEFQAHKAFVLKQKLSEKEKRLEVLGDINFR